MGNTNSSRRNSKKKRSSSTCRTVTENPFLEAEKSLQFSSEFMAATGFMVKSHQDVASPLKLQSRIPREIVKTRNEVIRSHPELDAKMLKQQLQLYGVVDADEGNDDTSENSEYEAPTDQPPIAEIQIETFTIEV